MCIIQLQANNRHEWECLQPFCGTLQLRGASAQTHPLHKCYSCLRNLNLHGAGINQEVCACISLQEISKQQTTSPRPTVLSRSLWLRGFLWELPRLTEQWAKQAQSWLHLCITSSPLARFLPPAEAVLSSSNSLSLPICLWTTSGNMWVAEEMAFICGAAVQKTESWHIGLKSVNSCSGTKACFTKGVPFFWPLFSGGVRKVLKKTDAILQLWSQDSKGSYTVSSWLPIHTIKTHLYMFMNVGRNFRCYVFFQRKFPLVPLP